MVEVKFSKGGQYYVFRYSPERSDEMIGAIREKAEDSAYNLDWLDEATLSFQVSQHRIGAGLDSKL